MGFTKPGLGLPTTSPIRTSSSNRRLVILSFLFCVSFPLLLIATFPRFHLIVDTAHLQSQLPLQKNLESAIARNGHKKLKAITEINLQPTATALPRWLEVIHETRTHLTRREHQALKVGLVNFHHPDTDTERLLQLSMLHEIVDTVTINFESVSPNITWEKLFGWIDENKPAGKCPKIPMPEQGKYLGLDVVVAQLPCKEETKVENMNNITQYMREGIRDVDRLQVSLATSHLIVESGGDRDKDVYAVFIGKCEPMVELFRCDDMILHEGEYWVYKPRVEKLREIISMPVGACDLAHPYYSAAQGNRQLQPNLTQLPKSQIRKQSMDNNQRQREAYVTVLHSSEAYVCGAIALAQSIQRTNSSKDLVLLADHTISNHSIAGLKAAGWKIKRIERIRSPNAKVNAYNAWNYSKLRVWQLTEYDKVIFIDSDFIVFHNIDHFFDYPQLSASFNNKWLFNSGIMVVEPSECFFDSLMRKRYTLKSYNGGDQGYLNEVLTWWHRLPNKLNFMRLFASDNVDRLIPKGQYTIHFLGMKPWTCYRDYDCNWDMQNLNKYASDDAHAHWWQVYDAMPRELQSHCGMTKLLDSRVRNRRAIAQKENLLDGHWKIELKDPRQYHLV